MYYEEDDEEYHNNENSDEDDNEESDNENDVIKETLNDNRESKYCKKPQSKSKSSNILNKSIKGKKTLGSFRSPSAESSNADVQIVENNTPKSPKSRRRRKKRYKLK